MDEIVKYEGADGQLVQFTAKEVKDRLCPNATDKELALLMALCQAQKLNPFVKDVYLIKYGNSPASMVTSKEVFTKRAQANPKFDGMEAGITVIRSGNLERREGSMLLDGEALVGGWCRVYVKGYRASIFDEVSMAEYSTGKGNWSRMPATMIRKVALCHALREAFPDDFQGLYGAEEMGKAGETVLESENGTAEAATAPQDAIPGVLQDVEFVELVSDQQVMELQYLIGAIAEAKGQGFYDVWDAVRKSRTGRGLNLPEHCASTEQSAFEAVKGLLESWMEQCNTADDEPDPVAEVLAMDLEDEDIPF